MARKRARPAFARLPHWSRDRLLPPCGEGGKKKDLAGLLSIHSLIYTQWATAVSDESQLQQDLDLSSRTSRENFKTSCGLLVIFASSLEF